MAGLQGTAEIWGAHGTLRHLDYCEWEERERTEQDGRSHEPMKQSIVSPIQYLHFLRRMN